MKYLIEMVITGFLSVTVVFSGMNLDAGELVLAENGKSNYVIVVPENAPQQVRRGATDLRSYFKQMTGVELMIFIEAKAPENKSRIALGATEIAKKAGFPPEWLNREERIIKTSGKDLILTGGAGNGTLAAVYAFLEKQGGCDWFDGWTAKIPVYKKFMIPDLDIRKEPDFRYRQIFTLARGWAPKMNIAPSLNAPDIANPAYGRPGNCHTFYAYSKDWPKDNLKLFTMNARKKREMPRGMIGPNFCLSNPETARRVEEKLREFIKMDQDTAEKYNQPKPFIYDISQNDCNNYFCLCKNCKELAGKYGQSGLLLTFINKIAENVSKDHPEIMISTFAYAFATHPPKGGIVPADNVMIRLCNTVADYYQPIEGNTDESFLKILQEWGRISKHLAVWDYWVFYWDKYPAPYHNVHFIKKNLELYKTNHAKVILAESEASETASFFALKVWLGYKLMDDLSQSDNDLIARFMDGYYGPGAEAIREYYEYLAERQKEASCKVFGAQAKNPPDRPYLDRIFYLKAEEMLNRAEAACSPGSIYQINVRRERIPVDASMLALWNKLNLPFERKNILERYEKYAMEQIRFRKSKSAQGEAIGSLKAEIGKLKNAEAIERQKAQRLRSMHVPRSNDWTKSAIVGDWFEVYGVKTERKISMQVRHDGDNLYLRFLDEQIGRPLRSTVHLWDGDEWEIMLADQREGKPFFQLLADSSNKMQTLINIPQKNGGDLTETYRPQGITIKNKVKNDCWELTVKIPFSALPFKKITTGSILYGNFFRSANEAQLAQSWNPTFGRYFRNRKAFGKIILEK